MWDRVSCGTEFLGGTQLVCPLIAVFSIGIFPTPCGGNPCFQAIKSAMIQLGNWQGIGVTPISFGRQTVKVSHPPCHLRHLEVRLLDFFGGDGKMPGYFDLGMSRTRGIPELFTAQL